jgi:thiol-disulfide isomerase/thioredoxin
VTSQSPEEQESVNPDYENAWQALTHMLLKQGASFSGRERNCLFQNTGTGRFANVSAASGMDYSDDARGAIVCDWDGDGRQDLIVKNRSAPRLRFLHNRSASPASWIQVELIGTQSNRSAIGARVTVKANGQEQTKTVRAGDGYLTQSSLRLHFGLGKRDRIDSVKVRWPGGAEEDFGPLSINQLHRCTEGRTAQAISTPAQAKVAHGKHKKLLADKTSARRILLRSPMPLDSLQLPSFEKPQRKVADLKGQPTLVLLWATWCASCHELFADLLDQREIWESLGLRVVLMTTDEAAKIPQAKKEGQSMGLLQDAGAVSETLQKHLSGILQEVLGYDTPLALPTSLLLDASGQCVVLYQGAISTQTILKDLQGIQKHGPILKNTQVLRKDGFWTTQKARKALSF